MALAAEQDDYRVERRPPAEVVAIPSRDPPVDTADSGTLRTVREYTEWGTRIAITRESARDLYQKLRTRAIEAYSTITERVHDLGRSARNRARQSRQERPVQLISILATAAFAAGIAIRIWRSRTR